MKPITAVAVTITVACVLLAAPSSANERLTVTLVSDDYHIIDTTEGTRLDMDGFNVLMEPGRPMLPARRFLVALPPGARVEAIHVQPIGETVLEGPYDIVPAPPGVVLTEPDQEDRLQTRLHAAWREAHDDTYGSDDAYPSAIARVAGSGTLRKYAYVSIEYAPFRYHPLSGRLVHHTAARVDIEYAVPEPGSHEAWQVEQQKWDTVADARAARLFMNFDGIADSYRPLEAARGTDRTAAWGSSDERAWGSPGDVARDPFTDTHDYLIVTSATLENLVATSSFVTWKRMLGHDVLTLPISDIAISSQPGRDAAEKLRNFLRTNYISWGIEYVLLVGNVWSVPMRYCYPDPANHAHHPTNPGNPGGSVPTDYYYADLSYPDGLAWDSDGDGFLGEYGQDTPDFLAEVYVGRIPTDDPTRVAYALEKIVAYEQDTGAWKSQALHAAAILFYENQDYRGIPKIDGATCLAAIESNLMADWTVSHYSEHDGLDPSAFPWSPVSQPAFAGDWRTGQYGVVNWSGHGSPDGAWRFIWNWDDGDGVPETGGQDGMSYPPLSTLTAGFDDDYPSIVFAISCNVGYPEPNGTGNMGIDLLTDPGWGTAVGVLSATRPAAITADFLAYPGGAEGFCYDFNRLLIDGPAGPQRVGAALYDAKFNCNLNYPLGWLYEYQNMYDYNLYGDPALDRRGVAVVGVEAPVALGHVPGLMQNRPNPFYPVTTISYVLPSDGRVRLGIYNALGQQVATLVDGPQTRGPRSAVWDATGAANGVYFCRIETGDFIASERMVLAR